MYVCILVYALITFFFHPVSIESDSTILSGYARMFNWSFSRDQKKLYCNDIKFQP